MPDVVMPRLSDSMEEGTILRWLKAEGDEVKKGDELAEIETDKATLTYEADADGVFTPVAKEGDTLSVGDVIAKIGEGSSEPASDESDDAEEPEAEKEEEPPAEDEDEDEPKDDEPEEEEPEPAAKEEPEPKQDDGERIKASPVARRLAKEKGIDLASIEGSGPGGRIVKADVAGAKTEPKEPEEQDGDEDVSASAASSAVSPPKSEPEAGERGTAKGDVDIEELTRTQQVVARRMAESKATVPEFTVTTEVDMERCIALREDLKRVAGEDDVVPSFNDMIVKACAISLKEHPRANGAYRDGRFELYSRVNIGVAVAAQDSLVVPIIHDADIKNLGTIAKDMRKAAARVRDGTVTPPELSGGTFTVSNLGMYGVTEFTAIINAPQAAILAVGGMQPRPVVHENEVVVRNVMRMTLVCDHRILYGADAAQFLGDVRELLEEPLHMAL